MKRVIQVVVVAVAVIFLMGAGDTEARFNDLGHRMMCVCSCSQILLECNHVGCTYSDRMRAELMAGLDRGESDSLVLQAFEQKYGTAVIAAPASTGFSLVAWIMPFLVLVLGCVGTVLLVRAWKKRPAAARSGVTPVGGADLELFRQKAREDTQL